MPLSDATRRLLGEPSDGGIHPMDIPEATAASNSGLSQKSKALLYGDTEPPEEEQPGFVSKAISAVTLPFRLPSEGVSALARAGARAQGIPVSDDMDIGTMTRAAFGLSKGDVEPGEQDSVGRRLLGRGVEEVARLGLDPLTYVGIGALGKLAGRGGKALGTAEKVIGAGFTGLAGKHAFESGGRAYKGYQEQGFTPDVAEEALGAGISAGFAGLGATHLARGRADDPAIITRKLKVETPDQLAQRLAHYERKGQPELAELVRSELTTRMPAEAPVEPIAAPEPIQTTLDLTATPDAPVEASAPPVEVRAEDAPFQAQEFGPNETIPPEAGVRPVPRTLDPDSTLPFGVRIEDLLKTVEMTGKPLPEAVKERPLAPEQVRALEKELGLVEPELAQRGSPSETPSAVGGLAGRDVAGVPGPEGQTVSPTGVSEPPVDVVPPGQVEPPELAAARQRYEQRVEGIKSGRLGGTLKGAGMQFAAEKRRITGELTGKEQANKAEFEARIRAGDTVSGPDGATFTVLKAPSFGRVRVRDAEGRESSVTYDQISKQPPVSAELIPAELEAAQPTTPEPPPLEMAEAPRRIESQPQLPRAFELLKRQATERGMDPAGIDARLGTSDGRASLREFIRTGVVPSPERGSRMALIPGRRAEGERPIVPGEQSLSLAERQAELLKTSGEGSPLIPGTEELIPGANAARERIMRRAKGGMASAGLDPQFLADHAIVGADFIAKGVRDFGQWSSKMVSELGESIRPHLQALWDEAQKVFTSRAPQPAAASQAPVQAPVAAPVVPQTPQTVTTQSGQTIQLKPIPQQTARKAATNAAPSGVTVPPTVGTTGPVPPGQQMTIPGTQPPAPKKTITDMVIEGWKSGLVSGPGTHIVNPLSNAGEAAVRAIESFVSGPIDKLLGGERTRFSDEAAQQIKGAFSKLPQAINTMGTGIRNVLKSEGAIPGKAGEVARIPFQLLQVEDAATSVMNAEAVSRGFARREARRQNPGASKAQIEAAEQSILQSPSPEFLKAVEREVQQRQFKGDPENPNTLIEGINKLREKHKWLHIPLPFTTTPGEIAKIAIQRSPLGYGKAFKSYRAWKDGQKQGLPAPELRKLKGEAVDQLSRATVGTAMLGTFAAYAQSGGMTGSGPTDYKAKALKRDTGWQPYSFVVDLGEGKKAYVPFNRFEPVSTILGFAADLSEMKDQKKAADVFDKALGSLMQNLTSKTYLQGLADAAEFVNDPKRFGGAYIGNLAGSVVPNIVSKAAQAIDPLARDARPSSGGIAGVGERLGRAVMSDIPGVTQQLPERRTALGETVERPGNALSRFLSPIQITTTKPGRELEGILADQEIAPSAPSRTLNIPQTNKSVRLSDSEYRVLQDARRAATEVVRRKAQSPRFQQLSAEEKKRIVSKDLDRAGDQARRYLLKTRSVQEKIREAVSG